MSSDNERPVVLPELPDFLRDSFAEEPERTVLMNLQGIDFLRRSAVLADRACTASSATSPQEAVGPAVAWLAAIKLYCLNTVGTPAPRMLAHIVRMCIDAGIVERLGEGLEGRARSAAQEVKP